MRGRGGLSCKLKPASFELTMPFLSQARRLGRLHRASPVPFRASYFTSGLHPPDATAQRLIACLYRLWSYRLSPFTHSIFTPRGALVEQSSAERIRFVTRRGEVKRSSQRAFCADLTNRIRGASFCSNKEKERASNPRSVEHHYLIHREYP